MGDTATSVLARLKNKAKETGRSYQLCLPLLSPENMLNHCFQIRYEDVNMEY